ncbi:MAG: isoleucine--tRNA ligase [Acidimicrobiia bacterium]
MTYPVPNPHPSFPALEREVVDRWVTDDVFAASLDRRAGSPEFVFYDGPPFANGLPHYGHLLTGFVKDAVPRYKTMRGFRVDRRFGWDCHGLPVEMASEQALGVSGRNAILELGVDRFNEHCRSLVGTTADVWADYVRRQARWVDMEHDYKTMDTSFMESVMWAFATLYDKGLVYEGFRVLPYCWECETPLSNFETRLDNSYRNRQDRAVTVWFGLANGMRLLVWTTTPWTLPSNLAIAVNPDVRYTVFEDDGERYVIGTEAVARYRKELANATEVETISGSELVGQTYEPLFPYFADTANAFRVIPGDFVTAEDGTGAVHMAPGFGEDDQRVCAEAGISVVCPVDERGCFTTEVPDYVGTQVFEANGPIIKALGALGHVVRQESYDHSYPHCWRTDTPLIYKAVSSWFVNVTAIKDRMVELNQQITWVPDHVRDGAFGKWIENARDWSISRNRFWGSPIPVWKSDNPQYPRTDVYGSIEALERDFGVRLDDLHRPGIDALTRPNPDDPTGQSMMRRVEDVLDCWFESGSMPFAQVHYPFENREWFDTHFPGDFIVEYIGQTRGWFYTLHVLATALFDRPAFQTCLVHGVLLGNDGQKLSKRLKNYPDPIEVFDTLGSDAMRWALLSSAAVRGGDMVADQRPMEEAVRQILLPIWNAYLFLTTYANAEGLQGEMLGTIAADANVLDRYILAKTRALVTNATARMDTFDLSGTCAEIAEFLDSLNNWYIRRSRDRFWAGEAEPINVLHTVLVTLCQVVAPLLPLLTETVYRGLTGEGSVHLTDWPSENALPADDALVRQMDDVRAVCSAASAIRKANQRRNRLPLLSIELAGLDHVETLAALIADGVNVRQVRFVDADALGAERFEVDLKVVGPKLRGAAPLVLGAIKHGEYSYDAPTDTLTVADHQFGTGEFVRRLDAHDPASTAVLAGGRRLVRLDLTVTPELEQEGLARDIVRLVNQVRREEQLDVSDRIRLLVDTHGHADVRDALDVHEAMVMAETLAKEVDVVANELREAHRVELSDDRAIAIAVVRIDG